jgi:large subunit ribosomal protein L18
MASTAKVARQRRERRHRTIRRRLSGTAERPRLNVFRSSTNVYVQLVDDALGNTVAAASTRDGATPKSGTKVERARAVGRLIAERAGALGITRVVFDRGGYLYHGRVKAVADGARAGGLEF